MVCTTGCLTQDHTSYGDCLRAKALHVAYCDSSAGRDATRQKRWDAELDRYADARRQGIQPAGTTGAQIDRAFALSDATGMAYRADTSSFQ